MIASVNNKVITLKAKASEKGHLFKSIKPIDIIKAIKEITGIDVDEKSLVLDHIKTLGSHKVTIKKGNKKGECEINIEAL